MSEPDSKDSQVIESWQRFVQGLLGVMALVGALVMAHYYAPPETNDLESRVHQLTQQVDDLKRQGAFSTSTVDDARSSVAYIFGVYRVSGSDQTTKIHARVAGTGFIVAPGLLATNRHVAEPWYGDSEAAVAIRRGGAPVLEKLEAYFPGSPLPVTLQPVVLAKHGDLAILKIEETAFTQNLKALALAPAPPHVGDPITVLAYPMGVTGMVAKSPAAVYERLASHQDDPGTASELAALALIRPSATFGHIGDVSSDKLIYDAPTARGGSGGPVLNTRGQVVGVNAAYLDGFSGGTLGISAANLMPLIERAKKSALVTSAEVR